ncbi:hypothetical protein N7493_000573 [Penicillium malachiteum]|uniref:Uncharacterized protein n=1 Tax=Penicillium malachiteum TaxID=1324776 RepID=A0AAD6HWK5_9EURO|nr:hypothetical protein N7493_000573 [Penicillium malachiteum]
MISEGIRLLNDLLGLVDLYHSGLAFTLVQSVIQKTFIHKKPRQIETHKGHSYSIESVAFSPNSQTVASGSYDQMIKLWDAQTGKEL